MLENPIVIDDTLFPQTVFDYTLAVEVSSWMPEWYDQKQKQDLTNDYISQRGETMKYREMFRMLEKQHALTKTLFYIQCGFSVVLALLLLAIGVF